MTRAEHYLAGKAEGERWAEADLRAGRAVYSMADGMRAKATLQILHSLHDWSKARELGRARGYRLTVARFEAGELTWEMFDQAPKAPR